ncbi:hypothetical protein JW766_05005 [Candidatus Dojkabacteria bacterium]|nr:hypothetical protein [Candidatus Dojkabacteria bacterium]
MKKVGLCLILCIIAIVAAIFVPWENVGNIKDRLLGTSRSVASLKVYSLGGNMKVILDGEEKGTVRSEDPYLEIFPVEVGNHTVELERESEAGGFYVDFKREIRFEKGFDTVISWEIGPTEDSSSGWILYAQKTTGEDGKILVNLTCDPGNCEVQIDDQEKRQAPLSDQELSIDSQHTIKASRYGYQDLEFQVLPEEDSARAQLAGYVLFLEVNLYKIPVYN